MAEISLTMESERAAVCNDAIVDNLNVLANVEARMIRNDGLDRPDVMDLLRVIRATLVVLADVLNEAIPRDGRPDEADPDGTVKT